MKKLDLTDKKLILITIEGSGIQKLHIKQCYNNNGLLSVKVNKYSYYCREDQDYYCNEKYALVNNVDSVDKALNELIDNKVLQITEIIINQSESIQKKKNRINQLLNFRK